MQFSADVAQKVVARDVK